MEERHILIIETHNPYTARAYKKLADLYVGKYEIENRDRGFLSHVGEADNRTYTRIKMLVTKEQEHLVRNGVRRLELPAYRMELEMEHDKG